MSVLDKIDAMDKSRKQMIGVSIIGLCVIGFGVYLFSGTSSKEGNTNIQTDTASYSLDSYQMEANPEARNDTVNTAGERLEESNKSASSDINKENFAEKRQEFEGSKLEEAPQVKADPHPSKITLAEVSRKIRERNKAKKTANPLTEVEEEKPTTAPDKNMSANTQPRSDFFNKVRNAHVKEEDQEEEKKVENKNLYAVIHQSQVVRNGDIIRLRTTSDFTFQGLTIPANTFIFGDVKMGTNRVNISISKISFRGKVLNVEATVHDATDGREGIHFTGTDVGKAISKGVKSTAVDVIQSTGGVAGKITANAMEATNKTEAKCKLTENHKLIIKFKD